MEEQELINKIQGLVYEINALLANAYDTNLEVQIKQQFVYSYLGAYPKSYLTMEAFKRLTPMVVAPTGI